MAREIIATTNSYGFRGSYWEKGQITELESNEKVPEYFKIVGAKDAEPKQQAEPSTLSSAQNQDLIDEALGRGIKDANILNQDELLEVLAKDTKAERIAGIIKTAKERGKKPNARPRRPSKGTQA